MAACRSKKYFLGCYAEQSKGETVKKCNRKNREEIIPLHNAINEATPCIHRQKRRHEIRIQQQQSVHAIPKRVNIKSNKVFPVSTILKTSSMASKSHPLKAQIVSTSMSFTQVPLTNEVKKWQMVKLSMTDHSKSSRNQLPFPVRSMTDHSN